MKKYGLSMVAGLAALAIASTASAGTNTLHISGSTAFRSAAHAAITHILNPGFVYGYSGTSLGSAGQAEFLGTLIGDASGTVWDIRTYWTGSVGGIKSLAVPNQVSLTNYLNAASSLTAAGTQNLTGPTETANEDVAFADSFQGSSLYTTPTLTDTIVGVIPFSWVRSKGAPTTISNITPLLAQEILAAGQVPLAQFTGLAADTNVTVTIIGRDEDSGTRVEAYAETGFGIFGFPLQYQALPDGGSTVTSLVPYPAQTVLGTAYGTGHSGYASGGNVKTVLNATMGIPNMWIISYLGRPDAAGVQGGANNMTFNGFADSDAAIQNGQYPYWSYEHVMYRTDLAANKKAAADQLANQIIAVDGAVAGPLLSTMKVSRPVEGGVITPLY